MVAAHICGSCRGFELPGFEQAEPIHCHGHADRPAPPGVLGGFRCACPCRYENEAEQEGRDGMMGSA